MDSKSPFAIDVIDQPEEDKIEQPLAVTMGLVPKHPFRWYIVGASGSGKTNLLMNVLSKDVFYKGFFDSTIVISPIAGAVDKSYKTLELDEYHYYEPEEGILERIRDAHMEDVETKGKANTSKTLVIFDDVAHETKFLNSRIFLQFAVMSRHWNVSVVILSQAYHRVPKPVRLQFNALAFFKGSNREMEVLNDDFCPAGMNKRDFYEMINYATDKPFSFLMVDLQIPLGEGRYRKNLEGVIF